MASPRKSIHQALHNPFLRQAMERFARDYRSSRERVFQGQDLDAAISRVRNIKARALDQLPQLYQQFKQNAEAAGSRVHWAHDAAEANQIIASIAAQHAVQKIVKSKSMTAEEIGLNRHLEAAGMEVVETDLGEWIVQLRGEGPSHMVMPAIHLSRDQVADLFSDVTGETQAPDIEKLVRVARKTLRPHFFSAGMGITGANFAVAEAGALGLVTNEGNARLVTTLPPVHVALVGIDKLVPTFDDALTILDVLPKNATAQPITSYVTWIRGRPTLATAQGTLPSQHIVFLDNQRLLWSQDPVMREALQCVRCGACANVCPIYRMIGGHAMGHIYVGAIGLINTFLYHDGASITSKPSAPPRTRDLLDNCIQCGACREVCAANIDLPRLIQTARERKQPRRKPLSSRMVRHILSDRRRFHRYLKVARSLQKPLSGGGPTLRHLPLILTRKTVVERLPALATPSFREWFADRDRPEFAPTRTVALFAGCLQDFVYPEQLKAMTAFLEKHQIRVRFPMNQTCCGLPLAMMNDIDAARDLARINIEAFVDLESDAILSGCASCASHLKMAYAELLKDHVNPTLLQRFTDKVQPFSTLAAELNTQNPAPRRDAAVSFHAPCHLCRHLHAETPAQSLLQQTSREFLEAPEAKLCCGFGGTYAMKYPELSQTILDRKIDDFTAVSPDIVVTECPGCIMQLRSGAEKHGASFPILHLAEWLMP